MCPEAKAAPSEFRAFRALGRCLISASGGGWMPNASDEGNGKATYGFDIWCNTESGYLNGSWVYQDKADGINAHGTLTDTSGGWVEPCHALAACATAAGGYVRLDDTGFPGPDKGDTLTVHFMSGPYEDYYNSQTIGGGNLTVFAF